MTKASVSLPEIWAFELSTSYRYMHGILNRRHELSDPSIDPPVWLTRWMEEHGISLWGIADLRDFSTPQDETGQRFPFALSWAIPMDPEIMVQIQNGPNQAYADEYARVNDHINVLSKSLAAKIKGRGFRSKSLGASERTDTVNIKGDFPHKTAATRAGLGWIQKAKGSNLRLTYLCWPEIKIASNMWGINM